VSARTGLGHYFVGRVHERFGIEREALAAYDRAVELDSSLVLPHVRKGYILSQRDDLAAAKKAYEEALAIDPRFPGVHTRIGLILTHMNRMEAAIESFQTEIRAGSPDADTYYNLGTSYSSLERDAEAVKAYREALRVNPGMREALYSLARALRKTGDAQGADEADAAFRRRKEEDAAATAAREAGERDAVSNERLKGRRLAAETWVDVQQLYLAEAAAAEGAEEKLRWNREAIDALRAAVDRDPEHVEAHVTLIETYRELERPDLEKGALDAALRALPEEPVLLLRQARKLNELSRSGGDPALKEEELKVLQRLVTRAPDSADGHRALATLILSHFRAERPDLVPAALEHARKAVDLKPGPRDYDVLAWAYHVNGRAREAEEALRAGAALFPGDPELKKRLAQLEGGAP
jgi:tetratricopeptide (TPR) repeat protein